ncbi:MAG: 3-oxoacyl-(acyl-carrier-protein) synthase 2 [candidate division WS2 bacterium]|nr:3-oxoacyl-(acyl-carrier-protein) synthase 2 [Candidatus Lithacetigena glycinireducens]
MSTKGIVVTGIGIISPFGIGKDCFWNGLKTGKSCIKEITCFDVTDLKSKKAAMVPDYRPEDYDDSFRFCRASKSSQFTLIAADMAIKDAGLKLDRVSPHKIGIFIGSGHCALECTEKFYSVLLEKGTTLTNPLLFQQTVSNAPASEISIKYGIKGPSYVITSGNASGGLAISVAILNLKKGYIDIAIAGGVDTHFKLIHEAFMHLRHLSPKDGGEEICRPFDKKRNGIICGEGVGLIVIETIEHAIKRDAKILAEIVGDGASYDSLKASPHSKERSIAFAMMEAIKEAGLNKDEIEYIVSTANSSKELDAAESKAIKDLFGTRAYHIPASSIKSMIGETYGSSGVFNAISTIYTLNEGTIPPTINYENPDLFCDLNYVPNHPINKEIRYALVNSSSFSVNNSSILLKRYEN